MTRDDQLRNFGGPQNFDDLGGDLISRDNRPFISEYFWLWIILLLFFNNFDLFHFNYGINEKNIQKRIRRQNLQIPIKQNFGIFNFLNSSLFIDYQHMNLMRYTKYYLESSQPIMILSHKGAQFFSILLLLYVCTENRRTKKQVYLSHLAHSNEQTIFLSKFDIGVGNGQIIVKIKKTDYKLSENEQEAPLNLAILKDTKFQHFKSIHNCQDRLPLYQQTIPVRFYDKFNARHEFKVQNQDREHIYYVYIYNCDSQKQNIKLSGTMTATLTMYNNGSHFGEDQNFFYGYFIIVAIWIGILLRFCCPVIESIKRTEGLQKFIFYVGFMMLGLAYFYNMLNLLMVYYNGEQIDLLVYLYAILKDIAQAIVVTTLVSIAWGWSLIHLKHDITYMIIGTVITLINITCLIIEDVAEQLQEAHHKYDRMTGTILLILRLIIFIIFVIGIFKSRSESVGKVKHFLGKFGTRGGCYLIAWPVIVIFAQCFLPNYLHNQVITFIEEITHLLANAMLGYLFAFPNSDYQKVDKRQDNVFYPE